MREYLGFALIVAEKVGDKLLSYIGTTDVSVRATPKEIKTVYDEITDNIIINAIKKSYPKHSILTEETGLIENNSDFLWIIDPLDGTGNYVNNNPFFAVSIALWHKGIPQVAVIEAPMIRERYYAIKDGGSFIFDMNYGKEKKAIVSNLIKLGDSYMLYCEGGSTDKMRVLNIVNQYYPKTKGMRIFGSAALELVWVGAGRCEAYITPEISLWDIAAGVLFISEAGGRILDFDLKKWSYSKLLNREKINLCAVNKSLEIETIKY